MPGLSFERADIALVVGEEAKYGQIPWFDF
jgi:hypothetical protein